ncbi:MAG TPA: hypothetical protein VEK80_13695 [Kribbellaceae bacterium]|nr:hypothetical protein [Kribbellaceae bacterium]
MAGNREEARRWVDQARIFSAEITADEDREALLSDLETVPV